MDKFSKRKPNRINNYNYTNNGNYYVTICTDNRVEWLGGIADGQMAINSYGIICQQCWLDLPNHYNIVLDSYIIMPNHIHGIIIINDSNKREGYKPSPTNNNYSLSEIIRGFKTFSSKQINQRIKTNNKFKWQRSFYDHIIRNDKSLDNIREYIINNPATWEKDENNINLPVGTV